MFKAKIVEAKLAKFANQEEFLDVEIAILDDKGNFVETRKIACDPDESEKSISFKVGKLIRLYNHEAELAVIQAEQKERQKEREKKASNLKGEVIV